MVVTAVSISEELRRELLEIAAELQSQQSQYGKRVGYEEVIWYLINRQRHEGAR
jgi:hypothetical protein